MSLGATASAAPGDHGPGFQGEHAEHRDVDRRDGRVAPTARQRALAPSRARFNDLGTPRLLTERDGALATGLPADPEAAARAYVRENAALFGVDEADLELVAVNPLGRGAAVLLRQRFGDLSAGVDGLVTVAVRDGRALFASSSLARDSGAPAPSTLSAAEAVLAATRDAGRSVSAAAIAQRGREGEYRTFSVPGFTDRAHAREVAVPTPDGARAAYQVVLVDGSGQEPLGVTSYVDGRTGEVLVRQDIVDHAQDNPTWDVFPNVPPLDYSSTDTRELWCWEPGAPGCELAVENDASPFPWDVDARLEVPTFQTRGNNARSTEKWLSNDSRVQGVNYSSSATRDYAYPWTNQWYEDGCSPDTFTSPERNDIDAATANLFAMHNRMHDWSYRLGFTENAWNMQEFNFGRGDRENDPEHGNSQAGGIVGGPPTFASRDNANQITPPDGVAATTNMYLWQPIAGAFYAPCVDGDYDMTVIGHEYTHAISNRMVAGPDNRLTGLQANAMGESWSDLMAVEYLAEYGYAPSEDENPFAVGPYVTNDKQAGIRNYGMNFSDLNYSDVGYDVTGPQVHADGEIWSAVQYDIREAFNDAYDSQFPSSDGDLQRRCADGETPLEQCPGNRRWVQLVFDAWLLMADGAVSMVDARDAMLAADQIRFGGANQKLLWDAFAYGGLGEGATSAGVNDPQPEPSFASPTAQEGTVVFAPRGARGEEPVAELYVGVYEARVTPVADTDPATARDNVVELVPGTYDALIRADGYGATRVELDVRAGRPIQLRRPLEHNLASSANGATASGDGTGHEELIDDTEGSQWASLGAPVEGRQVTVRLDPSRRNAQLRRVQVSAQLRPRNEDDENDPSQSRFSALRAFEILACDARGATDCEDDGDFRRILVSPDDAFPSVAPRPRAPELTIRSFDVPRTQATHVRLRVLTNQCTGAPDYQGEQDQDPRANTDCSEFSSQANNVRAAELQVFGR